MQVFSGHTGAVRCGGFTPDGKAVVTGGGEGDATLKVWDPKSGNCTGTVQGYGFHEAGEPVTWTFWNCSLAAVTYIVEVVANVVEAAFREGVCKI